AAPCSDIRRPSHRPSCCALHLAGGPGPAQHQIRTILDYWAAFATRRSAASPAVSAQNTKFSGFGVQRAAVADTGGAFERLIHDAADRARAATALGAAAQATIDLARGTRTRLRPHRSANVVVGQYIAGANDHG